MEEVLKEIAVRQEAFACKTAEQITKLQQDEEKYNALVEKMKERLVALVPALESMGLNLTDLRFYMNDRGVLVVSATGTPFLGSKFKFIAFAGYKADGSGKNQNRLDSKAEKMKEVLGVSVNPFSLETKKSGAMNRVLLSWTESV